MCNLHSITMNQAAIIALFRVANREILMRILTLVILTIATASAAMQALLLVAESNGDPMFARIGVMRALHRHRPKVAALAPRVKRAKAYAVL